MFHVRVAAPTGITLRAPLKLKLSPSLLDHRRHVVKEIGAGLVEIGRAGVNFADGDKFGVDGDVTGPVSGQLVELKTGKTLAVLQAEESERASLAAAKEVPKVDQTKIA